MEPQIGTPDKSLESDFSPSLHTPGPQTAEAAGNGGGGEDPRDSKHSNPEISDLEKKQRRAERFGMQVQLSEEEKRSSRAERFGTGSAFSEKNGANKREEDKRKARAERFGLPGETPIDDEAKKKARLEKFAAKPALVTPQEEEKRKARALRFSGTSNAAPDVNSKANTEPLLLRPKERPEYTMFNLLPLLLYHDMCWCQGKCYNVW